jgi:hypothetical protein
LVGSTPEPRRRIPTSRRSRHWGEIWLIDLARYKTNKNVVTTRRSKRRNFL